MPTQEPIVITDAMRKRCKDLLAPPAAHEWYRNHDPKDWRRAFNPLNVRGSRSMGGPTIAMADSMEKAGLIAWEQRTREPSRYTPEDNDKPVWVAVLTPKGRAVAEAKKRPTEAQRRWLIAIGEGNVVRGGHSWVNGMRRRTGASVDCPARSSYVVTCALHDAGWIENAPAKEPSGPFSDRYLLTLTDAGRTVLTL